MESCDKLKFVTLFSRVKSDYHCITKEMGISQIWRGRKKARARRLCGDGDKKTTVCGVETLKFCLLDLKFEERLIGLVERVLPSYF